MPPIPELLLTLGAGAALGLFGGLFGIGGGIIAVPLLGSLLIPVLGWIGKKKLTGYLAVALIAATRLSRSAVGRQAIEKFSPR